MSETLKNVNPNVSVDCVVFGFDNEKLNILLIEQKMANKEKVQFALPGDLIVDDEGLDDAANRVLSEITGISGVFLRQFKAFGDPNRVSDIKDLDWLKNYRQNPQARVITVAYLSLVKMDDFQPEASSFAERVFWQELDSLPSLAFDHNQILSEALDRLRDDFVNHRTGFELLPEMFTLGQIQKLYEIILGKELDKRNFRKKILKEKLVSATNQKQTGVLHKPAILYTLNHENI
ncbi:MULTISPECIES: NUDIX hydrolase [Croceimicrobium]|uniref:NUDIX hydrolase n=1 Tax=Croceimicrobium hydrocarbonivorans TaxID=2761580 RepID=A0A7H0VIS2_9FLAO|nr:NUDIX domain-containing protein [Croceimicrobium hydrocarbonivorans]QNR25620.1 NUDIX hydrolase [Croceimicrobium hydrocarbonivorans]